MNTLSIEKLKKMRAHAASLCHDSTVSALDELIAIRELKGEQVPVAWKLTHITGAVSVEFNKEVADLFGIFNGNTVQPLYDRPQKPVEVADSIAMQNVKDIAHCLSDIRRFVEAKFMTVGDLPSPEGLLLSGPEWKHESDAIIAALNRVADFYESQPVLKEISYEEACLLSPNNDRPDITHGFKFGWNAYHKAAIEAAGGIVKDGE